MVGSGVPYISTNVLFCQPPFSRDCADGHKGTELPMCLWHAPTVTGQPSCPNAFVGHPGCRLLDSRLKRAGMTPHGASATAEHLPPTNENTGAPAGGVIRRTGGRGHRPLTSGAGLEPEFAPPSGDPSGRQGGAGCATKN